MKMKSQNYSYATTVSEDYTSLNVMNSLAKKICYIADTCHFQKIGEEIIESSDFDFHWNSVPTSVVCAFPYVIAFDKDSMEIRLIINGNLIQTMIMPKLSLICSKSDIFFATTAPEFFSNKLGEDSKIELPTSQHCKLFG